MVENNIDFDKMRTRLHFMFTLANVWGCMYKDTGKMDRAVEVKTGIAAIGAIVVHCHRRKETQGLSPTEMKSAVDSLSRLVEFEFESICQRVEREVQGATGRSHTQAMADQADAIVNEGIDKLMDQLRKIYAPRTIMVAGGGGIS